MRVAVIGSRGVNTPEIEKYLPDECDEIVSGGAKGVDTYAAAYAREHGLRLTEFLPQYEKYGRAAPILRNKEIVEYADLILAFWDGSSAGTRGVIAYCQKSGKSCRVILTPIIGT